MLLFRELKSQRGRVRPEQKEWLATLSEAGSDAGIWRPSDWPEIERLLTKAKPEGIRDSHQQPVEVLHL